MTMTQFAWVITWWAVRPQAAEGAKVLQRESPQDTAGFNRLARAGLDCYRQPGPPLWQCTGALAFILRPSIGALTDPPWARAAGWRASSGHLAAINQAQHIDQPVSARHAGGLALGPD